jgi:hypothetical protein
LTETVVEACEVPVEDAPEAGDTLSQECPSLVDAETE